VGDGQARRGRRRTSTNASAGQWADLADLVFSIAREVKFHGYSSKEAVSLSPSEATVMLHLHRHPGTTPSRIAHASGLQRSNLSTVLGGLEEMGLIERRTSVEDGREVKIFPTTRGTSNYALVRKEWADLVSAAAGDATDLDSSVAVLRKVEAGLVRLRQGDQQAP
jgi:DNA-binding MarR family transcriptional regulator